MSRYSTYLGSGVTVRYDFGTTGNKNKSTMLVFFHLFLTVTCTNYNFFHLDVNTLNITTYTTHTYTDRIHSLNIFDLVYR